MRIHSHRRPEPDPVGAAVALAVGCATGAAVVAGAVAVTDGTEGLELVAAGEVVVVLSAGEELGEELAVRLAIALLTLLPMLELHAVAMPAAPRSVAARSRFPVSRRMNGPFPHF
jgi:hypothetical protein